MVQAYLGFAVTYEDILCGQIGLKHCKVWPGQKKVELLRVNTNVRWDMVMFGSDKKIIDSHVRL